jgi:carboxyl-terminal processing protease
MQKTIYLAMILATLACQKKNSITPSPSGTSYNSDATPKRSVAKDLRDSVYFWSETIYLWYKDLPNAQILKPTSKASPEAVMEAVRSFSEKGPTGTNRDRWSFVMKKADWDNVASGKSFDHGLYYRFAANGSLYVRQVFKNSAAGLAGVQRGWRVIRIAGLSPTANDSNFATALSKALSNNTLEVEFELPNGSTKQLSLTATDYKTDPIQAVKVFEENSKKIGYFNFTDFLGSNTATELNSLFDGFRAKGVTDLIIDLRYNGGGYVALAQQLLNHLAPTAANGKLMYSFQYNDKLSTLSKPVNFSLTNNIKLDKIVVITTRNSASASELLINSLKPHADIKIVGSASHGKPVGFPVIPVMNYVVAPVAFKTINSKGEADYYEGFTPDYPETDDLSHTFGDPQERCLKTALEYIKTGKVTTSSSKSARMAAIEAQNIYNQNMPTSFEGMYVNWKK